jgi:hypothetical protein
MIRACPAVFCHPVRDTNGQALAAILASVPRLRIWKVDENRWRVVRKRGGRTRGTPNRRTVGLHIAKQALAAGESEAPLNALLQLRAIAQYFLDQADAERRKTKPCVRAINEAFERAARVLKEITPFERPRLTAMKVDVPRFNLSCLTDSELAFLRRTILKATAGNDRSNESKGRAPVLD